MRTDLSSGSATSPYTTVWLGALTCFVVAGSTGALYRAGLLFGLPAGLELGNIRHAHSHLMYFGWVTPTIMALLATRLPASRRLYQVIHALLVLAGLAYVPFLFYGYGVASIGPVRLPLSVILATANMLGWYAFTGLYVRRRSALGPPEARWFWDAALAFLVIASLGAWGLGLVQVLQPENPVWFALTLHLFLDLFADGWLVMAILGFAVAALPATNAQPLLRWGWRLLVAGLPVTFLLSIAPERLPVSVRLIGSVGAIGSAIGFGLVLISLGRAAWRASLWRLPLAFLGLKAIVQIGLAIPPVAGWGLRAGLRIPYLHLVLLGVVTLGLLAASGSVWGRPAVPGWRWVSGSVVVLLGSLLPLTHLWPASWTGTWIPEAALVGALAPVFAVGALWIRVWFRTRAPTSTRPGDVCS